MKKIVVVAFEVDSPLHDRATNESLITLYKNNEFLLSTYIGNSDVPTASFDLVPYDILSVHDTKVEEKADADETGTTTGTPELDEGPTG